MNLPVQRYDWRKNLLLFAATVWTVFAAGRMYVVSEAVPEPAWYAGWTFAVPLLVILVAHELGHYFAARWHGVPASLPYFIPLPPVVSPFGTMGAIIVMPGRIRSARALLDIGAAGPLAGMVVALPTMILGLKLSAIAPRLPGNFVQEGQSLLYIAIKRMTLGPIPSSHDVILHPTAFAAWAGFLVTSLNLLPFMQLDGGHVAYALFGHKHDAWSKRAWWVPAAMLVYNAWVHAWPVLKLAIAPVRSSYQSLGTHGSWLSSTGLQQLARAATEAWRDVSWSPVITSLSLWGLLLVLLLVFRRVSRGVHPPVDEPTLDRGRTLVARGTLLLAILLFMPSPLVAY